MNQQQITFTIFYICLHRTKKKKKINNSFCDNGNRIRKTFTVQRDLFPFSRTIIIYCTYNITVNLTISIIFIKDKITCNDVELSMLEELCMRELRHGWLRYQAEYTVKKISENLMINHWLNGSKTNKIWTWKCNTFSTVNLSFLYYISKTFSNSVAGMNTVLLIKHQQ